MPAVVMGNSCGLAMPMLSSTCFLAPYSRSDATSDACQMQGRVAAQAQTRVRSRMDSASRARALAKSPDNVTLEPARSG
jgi:hypothetical protein